MARNTRDVALNVEIQTAGEESLRKLGTEVRSLAQAGGDAAPQFLALANEIDKLAAQAAALSQFRSAAEGLDQLSAASRQASAEAARLKEAFDTQRAATEEARAARARLSEQQEVAKRALSEERLQLDLLTASYRGGEVAEKAYTQGVAERSEKIANLKKELADLKIEIDKQKAATNAAERDLQGLGRASLQAADQANTLARSLQQQTAAVETARAAGQTLGASFDTAAAAQERLDAALKDVSGRLQATAETEKYRASVDAAEAALGQFTAAIERQAASARGKLDPALLDLSQTIVRTTETLRETVPLEQVRERALRDMAAAAQALVTQETQLAAARQRAQQEAESELATIRESEEFMRRYTAARAEARVEALKFVEAEEAAAAAADKAARRTAELNAQAEQTARREQYVRELAAAFDAVEQQAAEAAASVQRLQGYFDKLRAERDVVASAFGTAGVRSIQAIELEMFDLQKALITLKTEFAAGRISIQDFERAAASAGVRMRQLKTEIDTIPGSKGVFMELAEGANNLITKFGALTAAIATVGFALKPVIDSFIALESTQRILTKITGSTTEAARQIEFLRDVSNQAGQKFDDLSQAYAKFAASALQTGVSSEVVERTFKAVALAAGTLGLSTDQSRRALEALSQIASKGVVSMEELRQQLGDALPGVLPLFARELGVSTQQLNKLVESGQLLSEEALPGLANALIAFADQKDKVTGLAAEWARFVNIVKEAGTTLLEGPLGKAVGAALAETSRQFRQLLVLVVSASEGFNVLGRTAGLLAAALTGNIGSLKQFREELDTILIESGDKISKFRDRALEAGEANSGLAGAAIEAGRALQGSAGSTERAAAAAGQAATNAGQQAAATQQAGAAAAAAAPQQQALAASTEQVAAAAGSATTQLVALKANYLEVTKAAEGAVKIADKNVDAKKAEAEAIKTTAQLSGDELRVKQDSAKASQLVAEAERASADAKQTVVNVLQAQRSATEAQARAEGKRQEEITKLLQQIDGQIEKEQAAATAADRSALAAETQAAAARVAAQAAADNSSRLGELAAAYVTAKDQVVRMQNAHAAGLVTQTAVNQSVVQAAAAQRLYADALSDTVAKSKFAIDERRALAAVEAEGVRVLASESQARVRAAQANAEYARSKGDIVEVARLERAISDETIKQKELEATALRNEASLIRDTARARIEMIDQQRAELKQLGTLTVEKERELRLERLTQEALLKTAQARLAAVKAVEAEAAALKKKKYEELIAPGGFNPGAVGGFGGFGSQAAVDARNKAITGEIKSDFTFKPGVTRTYQTGQLTPPTNDGMWEYSPNAQMWLRTPAGKAADEAAFNKRQTENNAAIDAAFAAAGIDPRAMYGASGRPMNLSMLPPAVRDQLVMSNGQITARYTPQEMAAQKKLADDAIANTRAAIAAQTAAATSGIVTPSQTMRYEINLNMGNAAATVSVSSAADAEAMKTFFRELEDELRRAGGGGP